jgi:hypothetical protein
MLPVFFNTPEVSTAYNAIVYAQNDLCKVSVERTLRDIDNLIYFLRERHGELERELATYDRRSSWSYFDNSREERADPSLSFLRFRPVFIAKISLVHPGVTAARRSRISHHLSGLDGIIATLSQANMALAERIRQKKSEPRNHSFRREPEEVEMTIVHPERAVPRYQMPLDRTPRTHTHIPYAAVVEHPAQGIPLTAPLTANSPATSSSPSASPPHSPPSTARTALEILAATNSFDKNA